jgi:hypothetical protein
MTTMRLRKTTVIAACALVLLAWGFTPSRATGAGTTPTLEQAASSEDALIADMLQALAARDPDALRRLRLTKSEYETIILPGSVPEGQPFRTYPPEVADVAWGLLDTRSRYYEAILLGDFGGKALALETFAFEGGEQRYGNHVAHKRLRLTARDLADGSTVQLATGSVVEIGGQWKFMSFIDD